MQWTRESDGRLSAASGGVDLIFEPQTGILTVLVTDYHAGPVAVDTRELRGYISHAKGQYRPIGSSGAAPGKGIAGRIVHNIKIAGVGLVMGAALCGWFVKTARQKVNKTG